MQSIWFVGPHPQSLPWLADGLVEMFSWGIRHYSWDDKLFTCMPADA